MAYQRPPSKSDLRRKLREEIRKYLQKGGKVDQIPTGESGRDDNSPLRTVLFDKPKESRTYVSDLISDIDQRRRQKKPAAPAKKSRPGGRYKIIYDDFGEPIRRIWVDD